MSETFFYVELQRTVTVIENRTALISAETVYEAEQAASQIAKSDTRNPEYAKWSEIERRHQRAVSVVSVRRADAT